MTPNPQDSAVALEVEREAIDQQVRQIYVSQGPRGLMQLCIQLLAEKARASQSDGTSGGWISIDERLPAHEQEVICSGFEGNDPTKKRWQEFAVFHRDGLFYNRETGDEYYPPTHWREMPAAPNQGENHVG